MKIALFMPLFPDFHSLTSFSFLLSSTSDDYSPLHPSHYQINELSQSDCQKTDTSQSQESIGFFARPVDEQTSAKRGCPPAQTRSTSSLLWHFDGPDVMKRPAWDSLNSDKDRPSRVQAVPVPSALRRYRFSSCLMSCLQSDAGS